MPRRQKHGAAGRAGWQVPGAPACLSRRHGRQARRAVARQPPRARPGARRRARQQVLEPRVRVLLPPRPLAQQLGSCVVLEPRYQLCPRIFVATPAPASIRPRRPCLILVGFFLLDLNAPTRSVSLGAARATSRGATSAAGAAPAQVATSLASRGREGRRRLLAARPLPSPLQCCIDI